MHYCLLSRLPFFSAVLSLSTDVLILTMASKAGANNVLKLLFLLLLFCIFITETYLYNFDPLKPHFYVVKLGFTGVNIIFIISAFFRGFSLEPPHRGGSNEYLHSVLSRNEKKNPNFYLKIFIFRW